MKVGVIGLGSIGKRHVRNLVDLGHEVFNHDPNVPSGDLDSLLEHSEAIVIASPTDMHQDHALMAEAEGKPAFIEKPLGTGKYYYPYPCMVGYNLRFHPCVQKAKEWLPQIGKPLWANFTVAQRSEKPAYRRIGVILNWSHEIDLALHLLGEAEVMSSSTMIYWDDADVMTDIVLRHESGCRSTVHMDYLTEPERRHFTIVGEKGRMTCTLPDRNIFLHVKDNMDWFAGKGTWDDDYKAEMAAFINRAKGESTPGCTIEEAMSVMEICLTVRQQAGL